MSRYSLWRNGWVHLVIAVTTSLKPEPAAAPLVQKNRVSGSSAWHGVLAVACEHLNPDVVRARLELGAQGSDAIALEFAGDTQASVKLLNVHSR